MKRIAVNSLVLTLANIGSTGLGFVLSVVIGRALGVEEFGRYALAQAWPLALALLADFGLGTLLTRDLARAPQHIASYLHGAIIFVTGASIALMLALALAAPLLAQDAATILALRLAAPLIWLSALYMSFTAIFRAQQRMVLILLLNVGGIVVQILGALVLALRGATAAEFILVAVIARAVQLGAAWWIYRILYKPNREPKAERVAPQELARASVHFAIAAGTGAVQIRAPLLLLGALSSESTVGLFNAASRFGDAIKMAPGGFFGAMFPALSQLADAGATELRKKFQRAERLLLAFGFLCALVLSLAASPILTLSYGAEFAGATPILIVLGWTLVPYFWGSMMALYLYAIGDEAFVNRIRIIGIGSQIFLSIPLMLLGGGTGAALAALIGEILMALLYRWRWARVKHYHAPTKPASEILGLPPRTERAV